MHTVISLILIARKLIFWGGRFGLWLLIVRMDLRGRRLSLSLSMCLSLVLLRRWGRVTWGRGRGRVLRRGIWGGFCVVLLGWGVQVIWGRRLWGWLRVRFGVEVLLEYRDPVRECIYDDYISWRLLCATLYISFWVVNTHHNRFAIYLLLILRRYRVICMHLITISSKPRFTSNTPETNKLKLKDRRFSKFVLRRGGDTLNNQLLLSSSISFASAFIHSLRRYILSATLQPQLHLATRPLGASNLATSFQISRLYIRLTSSKPKQRISFTSQKPY